jgi:hypothetical protein
MGQSKEATPRGPAIRGRPFQQGNGGRRRGSKNRSSVVAAALLEGEAAGLVRKGIELALAGDVTMLKFFLGRTLPRERLIKVDLPHMNLADDAVEVLAAITRAISEGVISPSEGAALATVVNYTTSAIEVADMVNRVNILEEKIKAGDEK